MKKFLTVFAILCGFMSANAQRAAEASIWESDDNINHSGIFVNPSLGVVLGNADTDFGVDLTLGYRWHIGNGFNWDVAKIGAFTGVSDFSDLMSIRILSGFRYNSAPILGDKSMYVDFSVGYSFRTTETSIGGFAYEIGVGANLSRTISLGLVWEDNRHSADVYIPYWGEGTLKYHYGLLGLRLGLNF